MTNSANSKTLKFKFGSLVALNMSVTATGGGGYRRTITNRGAANSQVTQNATANASDIVSTGGAPLTGAIDTTASVDITITGQLALGTETITLESYQVILYPRG